MIVTGAFSGPRVWSVDVIAGNVDVNDSGVALVANDVQVTGVGRATSFVTVGATSMPGCWVELHAVMEKIRATVIAVSVSGFMCLLLNRFLKLFKGCHP